MIMTGTIEFGGDGDRGFSASNRYQEIKTAAYEHLLSRIEELGRNSAWARTAIQEFVDIEVASFVRLRRVPINEGEMRQISEALTGAGRVGAARRPAGRSRGRGHPDQRL